MTTITEPTITREKRTIEATWIRRTDERDRRHLTTLTVRHYGRSDLWGHPQYVFRAVLSTVIEEDIYHAGGDGRKLGLSRSYGLGDPTVLVGEIEAKRYSAKRAEEFFAEALGIVERERGHNERVDALFS